MIARSTDARPRWMPQASRWLLALAIAGSALAVGTVHTITLCIVTGVLVSDTFPGALLPLADSLTHSIPDSQNR